MRPIYEAALVNPAFGDPGLIIDLKFERHAILFDIGDVTRLPTRKLLRVRDLFVSHTHMDHFAGFDHLLRVCLGRNLSINVYGPAGFIEQLAHKLAAYTWDLVANYGTQFLITAHELGEDGALRRAQFRSGTAFRREPLPTADAAGGLLLDTTAFRVRALPLQHHGITSLGFAFEEKEHVNVWKSRLDALGLPTGPWLTTLKRQVRAGLADDTPVVVQWPEGAGKREQVFPLGQLRSQILEFVPGQRVCYVTDVADNAHNRRALEPFLRGADLLFIEAVFLAEDRALAARKSHLTAQGSGEIAGSAAVRMAVPFHFSARYLGREAELRSQFEQARRASEPAGRTPAEPPLSAIRSAG